MTAIKILSREPQKSNILVSAMQIIPELDDGKIYRLKTTQAPFACTWIKMPIGWTSIGSMLWEQENPAVANKIHHFL